MGSSGDLWNVRYSTTLVYVDLCSALMSHALCTLAGLPRKEESQVFRPCLNEMIMAMIVLLCAEVVGQRVPRHRAVHSECSAVSSGKPVSYVVVEPPLWPGKRHYSGVDWVLLTLVANVVRPILHQCVRWNTFWHWCNIQTDVRNIGLTCKTYYSSRPMLPT